MATGDIAQAEGAALVSSACAAVGAPDARMVLRGAAVKNSDRKRLRAVGGKADFQRAMQHEQADMDIRLRQLLFAILRAHGRIRVSALDIAALDPRDRVNIDNDEQTGDVVVTYICAPSEEPAASPKLSEGLIKH